MPADAILDVNAAPDQSGAPEAGKPPVLVIVGATASGKSRLAIELAAHLPVEIVNADSRNFYRGMDIGTAKPTADERRRVPHHLVDILDPDEPMSVSHFQELAMASIGAIHRRGKVPVVVGGTPQYINALVEGWRIPQVPPNNDRRRQLEREAAESGVEPIWRQLAAIDPEAADHTGPNLRRIIRALEVYDATGVPFSRQRQRGDVPFRALEFELWWPRDVLYERIDHRADTQVAAGLVDEVRGLLAHGYDPALPAFSSIGYRQLVPAIRDGADLGDAIARIKLDTHRLVRHQQTWFRRNPRLVRVDMTEPGALDRIVARATSFCAAFLTTG